MPRRKASKIPSPTMMRIMGRLRMLNYWLVAQVALVALKLLRLLPVDKALNFADRAARTVGPWFGRHRVALSNLRAAYPEKSEAEIEAIALDMWGNMGRLGAEYIFLEQIFDHDPEAKTPGRIEVTGRDHFLKIASEDRPHIVFTAHLGNFELLPIAAATFGMKITSLFRPPNNPYLAEYIFSTRASNMGDLLASQRGASFALAGILDRGGNVGVLVDQKFKRGLRTTFFGRECETNPVLAMLARHYDCDVYPAHCIRLPGGRYRLTIEEKLTLPRRDDGAVDVQATTQMLNDTVERWIREDPGQWMWFHKRWGLTEGKRRKVNKAGKISADS